MNLLDEWGHRRVGTRKHEDECWQGEMKEHRDRLRRVGTRDGDDEWSVHVLRLLVGLVVVYLVVAGVLVVQ